MAGKMNQRPNTFQRFTHRFLMLRPVSAFMARVLHHFDAFLLRLSHGKYTVTQIVGLPVIQLTTTGAKTGQPRTIPLVSLVDGEKIALIASNFGQRHNPSWYYNLKAYPECQVHFSGHEDSYIAREAVGGERETYWQMAVSYYKGYAAYKVRAAHRTIPVMVLEPRKILS
jgi:deazaflavin-dependent oxidoreductase (nitroreductase family)